MRGVLAVMALAGLAYAELAQAQNAPVLSSEAQRTAYILSIKCYVANGVAAQDRRLTSGRTAKYREKAEEVYQFIFQIGRKIGNSDNLIKEDVESYRNILSGAFARDDKMFQHTRSECFQFGLM